MILYLYFARRFAVTFAGLAVVLSLIMVFFDLIEHLRRYTDDGVAFGDILGLTLLNAPMAFYRILPLVVILTTIAMFFSLARSSELVVTRAAGQSALRALVAPVTVAFAIGCLMLAVMNPIAAATAREYDGRVSELTASGSSVLALSQDAVWLRQGGESGQIVIRASGASLGGTELRDVSFLSFAPTGGPTRRVVADEARLTDGAWALTGAKVWPLANTPNPEAAARTLPSLDIPTELTASEIRDSFGTPASVPIWELPRFISRLQDAGFSARRHMVWFQMELAMPLFLVSMVMIGAGFTMRHQRGGRAGAMALTAVLLSFGLYFVRNFAQILGENGDIPAVLAGWAPPLAAIGLSLGLLLHLEDG